MKEIGKVVQMCSMSSISILHASLFYWLNFLLDLGLAPHLFNSYYIKEN